LGEKGRDSYLWWQGQKDCWVEVGIASIGDYNEVVGCKLGVEVVAIIWVEETRKDVVGCGGFVMGQARRT
jgi:hypothetical protein